MSMPPTDPEPAPKPQWREDQIANAKAWTVPENWDGDTYLGIGLPPWGTRQRCPVVKNSRRCRKACIPGGAVCNTHGGAAPQVKRRAQLRLLSLVDPALSTLARTLATTQDENLKAKISFGILDRTGLGKAQDISADVAKAVLMDRYYALRDTVEKERAERGQPAIDAEWSTAPDAQNPDIEDAVLAEEPDLSVLRDDGMDWSTATTLEEPDLDLGGLEDSGTPPTSATPAPNNEQDER